MKAALYAQRKMPNKESIIEYWSKHLPKHKNQFHSASELNEGGCFACGMNDDPLEKAHIVPKTFGGSDKVNNIHLLCPTCHVDSERLTGKKYWEWFISRDAMRMGISKKMSGSSQMREILIDFMLYGGEITKWKSKLIDNDPKLRSLAESLVGLSANRTY